MKENVTVEEALNKGKLKLVYLPMFLIIFFIGLGFLLNFFQLFGGWIIAVTAIFGFLFAWLCWSYFVVEWKVWAFENVRNVHELKRKAIEERLIWSDDSWFNKTEIIKYEQKQKLNQLEKKFLEKDLYFDDINVPNETIIKYSKSSIYFEFFLGIFLIGLGIYIFNVEKSGFFWFISIPIGIYNIYNSVKKSRDNSPKIILNELGIKLEDNELTKWDKVVNDRVYTVSSGKTSTTYLAFNNEEIAINDLDINSENLEQLLHVYRVRFEKNNPN